jgi:pimeloyl-ACP methyl ester carboxylesterase
MPTKRFHTDRAHPYIKSSCNAPKTVRTPDGFDIAVYESGCSSGQPILFIHGYCQSHLAWQSQVSSTILRQYRIVTYDLRGHGSSTKSCGKQLYTDPKCWAGEIHAILSALHIVHPIIVAWSLGSGIVCDYLTEFGCNSVKAINFVSARFNSHPATSQYSQSLRIAMLSPDLYTRITATRKFVRACYDTLPRPDRLETILCSNMVVPQHVRCAIRSRSKWNWDVIKKIQCPVLLSHGRRDKLANFRSALYATSIIPHSVLSLYPRAGHSPFAEYSMRFNRELANLCEYASALPSPPKR